jgi:hypothetical protein
VLPFCQRCTGLYVGSSLALSLQLLCRLRITPGLLLVHGLLLIPMVPLGYHWIPHGPLVRTVSGQFYAAGLVCYLLLLPLARWSPWWDTASLRRWIPYALGLLASLALVPALAWVGGRFAVWLLTGLGLAGLLVLGLLMLVNVVLLGPLFLGAAWRTLRG